MYDSVFEKVAPVVAPNSKEIRDWLSPRAILSYSGQLQTLDEFASPASAALGFQKIFSSEFVRGSFAWCEEMPCFLCGRL
jgi:hypothetical protein